MRNPATISLAVAFVCGCWGMQQGCSAPETAHIQLGDVVRHVERLEAARTFGLRDALHDKPIFDYVVAHLDSFLRDPRTPRSRVLSLLVWKAALWFGSTEQIIRAFGLCWSECDPPAAATMVYDLASLDGAALLQVLLDPGVTSADAICAFLWELSDRPPDRWGAIDYTPYLEALLVRPGCPMDVRLYAAYCLARWRGNSVAGRQARSLLEGAASTTGLARDLVQALQYWERWETIKPSALSSAPAAQPGGGRPVRP